MTSQNCYSPQYSLTHYQARALAFLTGLMAVDFTVTSLGILYWPGFQEANALFNQYFHIPPVFISFLLVVKVAVMLWIIIAVAWFNRHDKTVGFWNGGNILCTAGVVAMTAMLGGLVVFNLVSIL